MGLQTALLATATGMQVAGQMSSANSQAAVAEHNASLAEAEGKVAQDQAYSEEAVKRREVRRIQARQRALMATSGLSGSSSFDDISAETAQQGELDALAIRYGGKLARSRGEMAGRVGKAEAGAIGTAGLLGSLGTAASGAYQTYDAYQYGARPRKRG